MKVFPFSDKDEELLHSVLDDAVFDLDVFLDQYYDEDNHIIENDKIRLQQIELDATRKAALQNLDYRISNAKYPFTRKMKREMGLIPDEL